MVGTTWLCDGISKVNLLGLEDIRNSWCEQTRHCGYNKRQRSFHGVGRHRQCPRGLDIPSHQASQKGEKPGMPSRIAVADTVFVLPCSFSVRVRYRLVPQGGNLVLSPFFNILRH